MFYSFSKCSFFVLDYPKLKSVMEPSNEISPSRTRKVDEAASYLNHPSSAIRYRARQAHIDALKIARAPWYKALQLANTERDEDEYLNRVDVDEVFRNDILNNPNRYEYEKQKFYQFNWNPTTSVKHDQ